MKSKNILIVFIAAIFIASFAFVLKKCSELPPEVIAGKLEQVKDKNGNTHFRKEVVKNTTEFSKKEFDSLKDIISAKNSLLNFKDVQISAITKLNMSIRDTLKLERLEKDELNNKIWRFEKTYKDGTKTKIVMYEKDTTATQETNLNVFVTDYSIKEHGKRLNYIDVASQNENFTLNGSQVLRIPVKDPKDLLRLNWATEYARGMGNGINFGTSEINLQILPDGNIVPKLGAGVIWLMNDGQVYPYYKLGIDINLKRISK